MRVFDKFLIGGHWVAPEGSGSFDVIDAAIVESLASRSADEWAGEGRKRRIPMVVVPDAAGILAHPVFAERGSLAAFTFAGRGFGVPRTPFALSATPVRAILDAATVHWAP